MRVDLVFPPFWGDPSVCHVAIPALTSYLKRHGHDVRQWDVNLEALYHFFHDDTLRWAQDRIESLLGRLATTSAGEHLEVAQQRLVSALAQSEYTRRAIGPALRVFRDYEAFVNMDVLAEAKDVLNLALELVSAAHHPTRLEMFRYFGLDMRFSYERSREILDALDHPEENPFARFYRETGVIERFKARETQLVGFSISNQVQLIPTLTMVRELRRALPDVKVCLGGNIITRLREKIVGLPSLFDLVDYWVVYEGEDPLLALVDALENDGDPAVVPNLLYRGPQGPTATPVRTGRDVNAIGAPDFDDLPLDRYFQPGIILPYNSSIGGCYWRRCSFCEITGGYSNTFTVRALPRIVDDLSALCARHHSNYIYFTDEAESPKRLKGLAEGLLEAGLGIRWMAMAKAAGDLDHEAIETMFRSGCRVLMIGVESASLPVLKAMIKGTSPRLYERVLTDSHSSGIWTHGFFMFDFPTERYEHAQETLGFIEGHRHVIDSIGSSQFELGLLTPILSAPEKYDVEVLPNPPEDDLKLFFDYVPRAGKSPEESERLMKEVGELKARLYRDKGFPVSFSAAIGNSINFIALLLERLADCREGPELLPGRLHELTRSHDTAGPRQPADARAGTLFLDPDAHYGLYPLRDERRWNGSSVTACVLFHPRLPGRIKVLPVFTGDVMKIIADAPRTPAEIVREYRDRHGVEEQDVDVIGDFLMAMHSAGIVHVA